MDSFTNSNIYLSFKIEENLKRRKIEMEKVYGDSAKHLDAIKMTKDKAMELLKLSPIDRLDYKEFINFLQLQLRDIETMLNGYNYFYGHDMSIADIAVYVFVHKLLHPYNKESIMIRENFPELMRWAERVNLATLDKFTRKLKI